VSRRSGLLAVTAGCHTCGKTWETRNALGVAAQHTNRTGHYVWAEQTIATTWNGP
jgi:hypothetical protein